MLSATIATTMRKLVISPVIADNPLATKRMMTRGLRKRPRNCSQGGMRLVAPASLGPYRARRSRASFASRPTGRVPIRDKRRSSGSPHIAAGSIGRRASILWSYSACDERSAFAGKIVISDSPPPTVLWGMGLLMAPGTGRRSCSRGHHCQLGLFLVGGQLDLLQVHRENVA